MALWISVDVGNEVNEVSVGSDFGGLPLLLHRLDPHQQVETPGVWENPWGLVVKIVHNEVGNFL